MRLKTAILGILCLATTMALHAQDRNDPIPQVRTQVHVIEISDKALAKLGLLEAFRKPMIPKGTIKDWFALEKASTSFRLESACIQSGQEAYSGSYIKARFPESFESPEIYFSKTSELYIPSSPVLGASRTDIGLMLTFTPQVGQRNRFVTLELRPENTTLLGFKGNLYKSSVGNRALGAYPLPVFQTEYSRTACTLPIGTSLVQLNSYKGGNVQTGRYTLTTAELAAPPAAKKVAVGKNTISMVSVTVQRIRATAKDARVIETSLNDANKLQRLIDAGTGDLVSKINLITMSGHEGYASSVKQEAFPESFEDSEFSSPTGDGSTPKEATLRLGSPVFGERRQDLGDQLTVTPAVSDDGTMVCLNLQPKHTSLIGSTEYPVNIKMKRSLNSASTPIDTDVSTPIFATHELRTELNVRPGVPMLIRKAGHKNAPRIRVDNKYVTITDKAFEKVENSREAVYLYTIVTANVINVEGGNK